MPDCFTITESHTERGLDIRFSCFNCASESFAATVNGKRLNLDSDWRSELGYMLLTKGKKAVIDQIKRLLRASKPRYAYGYGVYVRGSKRQYYYLNGCTAPANDLSLRLHVFKLVKRHFHELGWKIKRAATAALGADYSVESVNHHYDALDPARMIIIRFNYADTLFQSAAN